MPYLQLQDQQFPLPTGEATIGAFEGAKVLLVAGDSSARAVLAVGRHGVVIRRGAPDAIGIIEECRFPAELATDAPPSPPAREAAKAPVAGPAAPRGGRASLATLEIKAEGPLKGMQFELHAAPTNVGRDQHNDIAIRDDSISNSPAKLQKRADGWWVVDQESTSGTCVGGRRVRGEQKREGFPDLRFGGIKMTFRPAAQSAAEGGSTRAIVAVDMTSLRRGRSAKSPAVAKQPTTRAREAKTAGCGA